MSSETVTIQAETSGLDRLAGLLEREHTFDTIEARAQRDKFIELSSTVGRIAADFDALEKRIEERQRQEDRSKGTNWPTVIGCMALIPTFFGILLYITTSTTDKAVSPIIQTQQLGVVQLRQNTEDIAALHISQAASTASDTESRNDRLQLNARVSDAEKNLASNVVLNSGNLALIKDSLGEVETQLKAASDLRNQGRAANNRLMSLIWQKVFNTSFPPDEFYATATTPSGGVP